MRLSRGRAILAAASLPAFLAAASLPAFAGTVLVNPTSHLTIPTYDGAGQTVHPDVVYFQNGWHGYKYWMAVTPYPDTDDTYENPSIYQSSDGITWSVPEGLTNPLEPHPSGNYHNCDPDIFYDSASDQLWLYFATIDSDSQVKGDQYIYRKTSSDGVNWSPKEQILSLPYEQMVSPTVCKKGSTYYLWGIDTGPNACFGSYKKMTVRTSTDGVNWGNPTNCTIDGFGGYPWHLDVIYNSERDEFWGVVSRITFGSSCMAPGMKLTFIRSQDGIRWSALKGDLLAPASGNFDARQCYRGSLAIADGKLKLWYSGYNCWQWYTGYTDIGYQDFVDRLSRQKK